MFRVDLKALYSDYRVLLYVKDPNSSNCCFRGGGGISSNHVAKVWFYIPISLMFGFSSLYSYDQVNVITAHIHQ